MKYEVYLARHSQLGFLYPLWKIIGDGSFSFAEHDGTFEVDETYYNSLIETRCPYQGSFTLVFEPYFATLDVTKDFMAGGTLDIGGEIIIFTIDLTTGDINLL